MAGVVVVLSIAVIVESVVLAIIIYHQMLMTNEINKRLLLITQESLERERITKEEQQEALIQLAVATETSTSQEAPTHTVVSDDEAEVNFFSDTNY